MIDKFKEIVVMKKKIFLVFNLLILSFFVCMKGERELVPNYLIFGDYYGQCYGNCVQIFRLESNQLLAEYGGKYPNSKTFYERSYSKLSEKKFNDVKDLTKYFPVRLLKETQSIIGSPDATDGGGYYVEYNYYGLRRFWLIDKMKSNIPTYLHEFTDKVDEKITKINN